MRHGDARTNRQGQVGIIAMLLAFVFVGTALGQERKDKEEQVDSTLNPVVVTGTNHATGRSLLPYTVSVVSHEDLEASGRTQLLSALSGQVPSLFVTERNIFGFGISNGGSGSMKIRGVGSAPTNAILMMVDGQPQFAGLYSHPVADFYETEYVDHVEVLRGPGSVLYGSNAMGGVINVITRQAKENGIHGSLSSQYGSYNTWQNALTGTARYGKFSAMASLGYDRTDGVQKGLDFRQYNGYAKVGYDFSQQWNVRVDYSLMKFIGNDPVYPRLSNPESTDVYHQNIVRGETSLTLNNHYERTNGALRVYYSYGNHYVDDPKHFHSLDDRFGILAYQNVQPWKGAMATVGFDFDRYSGRIPMSGGKAYTAGSLTTMSRQFITEYSPYIALSQRLFHDILVLNAGLRMANSDTFGTHWIPQVGLAVHPVTDWTLKGSVAKGYRNPSFKEMYLYKMANPDLDPENIWNYEFTVSHTFSRYLGMDVTGYWSHGSNLIQTKDMKNVNTGTFTNKGMEFTVTSRPLDVLSLRGSYSYLHTDLKNLTGAPRHQYFLGLTWLPIKQLTIDAQLRGTARLFVTEGMKYQSYATLSLKATYHVIKYLDLFLHADNLTNAQYTINRGYKMPGITVMGGFKLKI